MPWPLSQDYNEAIQTPAQCFHDPELKQSEAVCNALGMPEPSSGNFADVYAVESGQRKWAVKCFTRQIPGLKERYAAVSAYLQQVSLPFMVDFRFLEQGIRIRGQWYPILKMQWVEGLALNVFVRDNLDKPQILDGLCQIWLKMAVRLREANLAHCDLQHGNVLMVQGASAGKLGVKLVDYDGMCVPALELLKSIELGHPAYQHPQRLREGTYGLHIDRFPHLVIYTALRSLVVGGRSLWEKFDNGDNLLFKQKDFESPGSAPVFQELRKINDPQVQKLVGTLAQAAQKPVDQVPLLEGLVGSPKPASAPAPRKTGVSAAKPVEKGVSWEGVASGKSSRAPSRGRKRNMAAVLVVMGIGLVASTAIAGFWFLAGGDKKPASGQAKLATKSSAPLLTTRQEPTQSKPLTNREPKTTPKDQPVQESPSYLDDIQEVSSKTDSKLKKGPEAHFLGGKEAKHYLFTHPPVQRVPAQVTYRLDSQFAEFRTSVGLSDGILGRASSPLTFKVIADGKVLWESKPVQEKGRIQNCVVDIRGARILVLEVIHAGGGNGNAWAIWDQPRVYKTYQPERKPELVTQPNWPGKLGLGLASFRSHSFPNLYLAHGNNFGKLAAATDAQNATFDIVPGLSSPKLISFRSVNPAGHYFGHRDLRVILQPPPDSDAFRADATFKPVAGLAGLGGVSFESFNFPRHYIHIKAGNVYIDKDDRTDQFGKDATFYLVQPLAGPLDLLKLIRPEKDAVKGKWSFQGDTLISPADQAARVQIPYEPPEEYDVTVVTERKIGNDSFCFGLIVDKRQCMVFLNGWPDAGFRSALINIDGKVTNETTWNGQVLQNGIASKIVYSVRKTGVTVTVDGKTIISYKGDAKRLSMPPEWRVPNNQVLFLGTQLGNYHITKMELTPISGQGKELSAVPAPVAEWAFQGDAKDSVGSMHGTLFQGAEVANGRLKLNGKGAYMQAGPLPHDIKEKTLEVWVTLGNLAQRNCIPMVIVGSNGYDYIVYGELQPRKWIAGSESGHRRLVLDGPLETAKPSELVHIMIVYRPDNSIALFRNGERYGAIYTPGGPRGTLRTYKASSSYVLIGSGANGTKSLFGEVKMARLYDKALTDKEVASSFRRGADKR